MRTQVSGMSCSAPAEAAAELQKCADDSDMHVRKVFRTFQVLVPTLEARCACDSEF